MKKENLEQMNQDMTFFPQLMKIAPQVILHLYKLNVNLTLVMMKIIL